MGVPTHVPEIGLSLLPAVSVVHEPTLWGADASDMYRVLFDRCHAKGGIADNGQKNIPFLLKKLEEEDSEPMQRYIIFVTKDARQRSECLDGFAGRLKENPHFQAYITS
jgi:hypothetical protein